MAKDGADYIETIAKEGAKEVIERIKVGRKAVGKRPPFTRTATTQEKLARFMEYAMNGTEGWVRFLQERAAEGMPPQDCLVEMVNFVNWGQRQFAKSNMQVPSMSDMEMEAVV